MARRSRILPMKQPMMRAIGDAMPACLKETEQEVLHNPAGEAYLGITGKTTWSFMVLSEDYKK